MPILIRGQSGGLDTSDADAIAEDILINKKAYVNGTKLTGTLADYSGVTQTATGAVNGTDYELTAPNTGKYSTTSKLKRTKAEVMNDLSAIANPVNSFTLTGTYSSATYLDLAASGYSVLPNGDVLVYLCPINTDYGQALFVDYSLSGATAGRGFNRTPSADAYDRFQIFGALLTGITNKINITLDIGFRDATYDYIRARVTVTVA